MNESFNTWMSRVTRRSTHSYVRHDSFIRVTWLIHMCDMTHSYVRHDSFIRVTWLISFNTWMSHVTRRSSPPDSSKNRGIALRIEGGAGCYDAIPLRTEESFAIPLRIEESPSERHGIFLKFFFKGLLVCLQHWRSLENKLTNLFGPSKGDFVSFQMHFLHSWGGPSLCLMSRYSRKECVVCRMDESWDACVAAAATSASHGTHAWVMEHMNESWNTWMSHGTHEWVMEHMNTWVMTHMKESWHTWRSHDTHEGVRTHMKESWHTWRSQDTHEYVSHDKHEWAMTHMKESGHTWMHLATQTHSCTHECVMKTHSCVSWLLRIHVCPDSFAFMCVHSFMKESGQTARRMNASSWRPQDAWMRLHETTHDAFMRLATHECVSPCVARRIHVSCVARRIHVNASCHTWMSHSTHEWVMSHMNKSCGRMTALRMLSRVTRRSSYTHFSCKRATNYRALLQKINYKAKVFYGSPQPYNSVTCVTEDATSPKPTKSRNSNSSVSRGIKNWNWDSDLIWSCTKKFEVLDLVDFGGVALSVESAVIWTMERWGAGVEYHFQEFNEPYAPS